MVGQDPSYSPFEIHTCRSVLREDRINPPIDTECFLSGGATTLIFIVDGADAVNSFVMRSAILWNMAVPPESTSWHTNSAEINVALREVVERSVVDSAGFNANETGWKNTRVTDTFGADSDDVSV